MSRALAIARPDVPAGLVAVPVRTPLVKPGDDLLAIVCEAVRGIARVGDVIAVSETALALAQGQAVTAQAVRPSKLAYLLCRRAGALATVNQPESLQIVIDQVGVAKVLYAVMIHVAGRVIGRRGLFYQILGESVTAIDGYTGTMPPFERAIVLAPRDPAPFAQSVFERIGVACAVVDANDLQRAKVLGASQGVQTDVVQRALLSNPHGNSDEQTPIVVLKWRGDGASPLAASASNRSAL